MALAMRSLAAGTAAAPAAGGTLPTRTVPWGKGEVHDRERCGLEPKSERFSQDPVRVSRSALGSVASPRVLRDRGEIAPAAGGIIVPPTRSRGGRRPPWRVRRKRVQSAGFRPAPEELLVVCPKLGQPWRGRAGKVQEHVARGQRQSARAVRHLSVVREHRENWLL